MLQRTLLHYLLLLSPLPLLFAFWVKRDITWPRMSIEYQRFDSRDS